MNVRVLEAGVEFYHQPFLKPLQISSGAITEITEAQAVVRVRVGNREAQGRGSIYLSDLWAWPDPALPHDRRDTVLRSMCVDIALRLADLCGPEPHHPLELGMRLHESLESLGPDEVPALARAMCASPFDAAIHDAAGLALGRSAFEFYEERFEAPSIDILFGGPARAGAAIAGMLRPPVRCFDAWLIVSRGDDLDDDVAPWVRERGYRAFKVKILARDVGDDAARTAQVYRSAKSLGVQRPRISVDSNEANTDAGSVLDYLERLRRIDDEAFDALEYLEQPTSRDIAAHPQDWRAVTRLKPVLLDEGLTSLEVLDEATGQGWSGLALKTCKGHSFALAAAAWAYQRGLPIALQDLTNPGLSAIHAALFASRVPTINGVELNSPQYTPAANAAWLPRLGSLLEPRDGFHRLPDVDPPGLGSSL